MVGIFPEDVVQEAEQILNLLKSTLPQKIDGKEAIQELKRIDYNWRQMEWIGWYLEHFLFATITHAFEGTQGPAFGNTKFDYKKKYVWDFKVHPIYTPKGTRNDTMILNDKEAIDLCIERYGGVGFFVVYGNAKFDENGEFKVWHDALKGGHSDYEMERIRRGAPSRKRKAAFEIDHIEALFFNTSEELKRGISEGWIGFFQEGMRNADGSPRRSKYALKTTKAPSSIQLVTSVKVEGY